jgi:hypothetical protein
VKFCAKRYERLRNANVFQKREDKTRAGVEVTSKEGIECAAAASRA